MLKQLPCSNLSIKEKDALKTLFEREDIIIRRQIKEVPLLLLTLMITTKKLINKINRRKLPNNTTELKRTKDNTSIKELKTLGLLDKKTARNLKRSEAKIPQFNIFPKKKGNPGRPVVIPVKCHTTKISK